MSKYLPALFAAFVVLMIVGGFLGLSLWTDRTLDFWCSYFKGKPVDIPFWISALFTLVFNAFDILLNLVSEIIRRCI